MIYPFLHIAPDPQEMLQIGSIPSAVIADYEIQSMLKGLYLYIRQIHFKKILHGYSKMCFPNNILFAYFLGR